MATCGLSLWSETMLLLADVVAVHRGVCGGGCCVESPALTAQDTQVHPRLKGAMAAWVFGYESTDLQR